MCWVQCVCELADNLVEGGVASGDVKSLLEKLLTALRCKEREDIISSSRGHLYELFKLEKLREKKYEFPANESYGDLHYKKGEGIRTSQCKWVTGTGKTAVSANVMKALKQLKGWVKGNAERAPVEAMKIADVAVQGFISSDEIQRIETALGKVGDTTVQIRMTEVGGGDGVSSKRTTFLLQSGNVTTTVSDNSFRLEVVRTIMWSEGLADEVVGKKDLLQPICDWTLSH